MGSLTTLQRAMKALASITSLRTLNIRSMPSLKAEEEALLSCGQGSFQSFATQVIHTIYDESLLYSRPPLRTLALGSLTYRDICQGYAGDRSRLRDLHDYLRLRVFKIHPDHWGVRSVGLQMDGLAVLTEVGTYEKTEAAGGNVEVLRPYWLG